MVYRRRVYKRPKRRYGNTKRAMKRQMLKPKIGGKLKQPVHYFTRYADGGTISLVDNTTATYGVLYFELANIPGYSEFSAMYDFYKINAVQVKIIPSVNVTTGQGGEAVSAYYNRFFSVIDYNDRAVPNSVNDLRQYSTCKVTPQQRIHKRFFHPRPVFVVDEDAGSGSSVGVGQVSGKSTWIATASNQTEWYGIKYAYEHPDPNATIDAFKVEYKFYLSFKGKI